MSASADRGQSPPPPLSASIRKSPGRRHHPYSPHSPSSHLVYPSLDSSTADIRPAEFYLANLQSLLASATPSVPLPNKRSIQLGLHTKGSRSSAADLLITNEEIEADLTTNGSWQTKFEDGRGVPEGVYFQLVPNRRRIEMILDPCFLTPYFPTLQVS